MGWHHNLRQINMRMLVHTACWWHACKKFLGLRHRYAKIQRMSLLNLTYLGDPVLRQVATPVLDPTAVAPLAAQMMALMQAEQGVGLAAPQVGLAQRVIVFHVPEARADAAGVVPLQTLVNPSLTPLTETKLAGWEGCLSLPGLRGMVPRYTHIGYTGYDVTGRWLEGEATGFYARLLQHEVDHLDGVMYLDRMQDQAMLLHVYDWHRQLQQQQAQGAAS
jgi:peptide deformylase